MSAILHVDVIFEEPLFGNLFPGGFYVPSLASFTRTRNSAVNNSNRNNNTISVAIYETECAGYLGITIK